MVVSLISLIISLLALGFCLDAQLRERKASKELDAIIEDIKSQPVPDSPAVNLDGINIMTYDRKRNTIVVKGNIEAEGFISAGNKEE